MASTSFRILEYCSLFCFCESKNLFSFWLYCETSLLWFCDFVFSESCWRLFSFWKTAATFYLYLSWALSSKYFWGEAESEFLLRLFIFDLEFNIIKDHTSKLRDKLQCHRFRHGFHIVNLCLSKLCPPKSLLSDLSFGILSAVHSHPASTDFSPPSPAYSHRCTSLPGS